VEPDAGAYFSASRRLRQLVGSGSALKARPLQRDGALSPQSFTTSPHRG